jgi:hypothetical protein
MLLFVRQGAGGRGEGEGEGGGWWRGEGGGEGVQLQGLIGREGITLTFPYLFGQVPDIRPSQFAAALQFYTRNLWRLKIKM